MEQFNKEWKEEFFELYKANNDDPAFQLMDANYPKYLYKYCSFDAQNYNIDHLENNTIYLQSANKFNDPYDSKICIDRQRLKPFLRSKSPGAFEKIINDTQNMTKVSCFSENDIKTSLLMWGHYTNKHEGFCIKYDTLEIIDKLSIPDATLPRLYPIIYKETQLDLTDQTIELAKGKRGNFNGFLTVITKYQQWYYEQEWRLVKINSESEEGEIFELPTPRAIYLGTKIERSNKKEIAKIAIAKDILVYQMSFSEKNEYKLHPEVISKEDLSRLVASETA